jgi:hypothetical protein
MLSKEELEPVPMPPELPDINHTGSLNFDEFKPLLKNYGLVPGEMKLIFEVIDIKKGKPLIIKESRIFSYEYKHFYDVFFAPF